MRWGMIMSKNLFLFFLSFFSTLSLQATSSGGVVNAALMGDCHSHFDLAVYLATPLAVMLGKSISDCKKLCAQEQKAYQEAQEKKKEELAEKTASLKSKGAKEVPHEAWHDLVKPEKYSLKKQSIFFIKQLIKIVTDPQAAIADQPFFTTMLLLQLYRVTQVDGILSEIENKSTEKEIAKALKAERETEFGPDKQKIEHAEARKECLALPEWISTPSAENRLDDGKIKELITGTLMPKVNQEDKFSSVWERIAALFAGCLGNPGQRVPYLCLDGQPGVGKTYFAKELAKALDYHCEVIECGLVDSKSDNANGFFKGFARCWTGSHPGKIVKALQKAKDKKGIVIVLDEIDKVNNPDVLLALLDPEQNSRFVDNYLEVPIDLSNVIFISTSNDWNGKIEGRSAALASRLQEVSIKSYSVDEKKAFAKKQLATEAYQVLNGFSEAEALINELIDAKDNIEGGVRKVMQLLDAAQCFYQLSQITGDGGSKEALKAKVIASLSA
jgi:ATP-dependent Clp protease ATP-binding subunit ClpA